MIAEGSADYIIPCITQVVKQLQEFSDWREFTRYKVTEDFLKNKKIEYELYNLRADIEDDMLICDDAEGILEENDKYVLNMFRIGSIVYISQKCEEGTNIYKVRIEFKDGNISITADIN